MEYQPRLSRSEVLARLRQHAKHYGFVSTDSLLRHDRIVLASLRLYFVGLNAARRAAGVPAPPYVKPRRKTGPKPGATMPMRVRLWTRARVVAELRVLARGGHSTRLSDLLQAGKSSLVAAAVKHAGGLARARALAGIRKPARRAAKKNTWAARDVLNAIATRRREGKSLAGSMVPLNLYGAARRHFKNWPSALAAAGLDVQTTRIDKRKWTKPAILEHLRRVAKAGSDLRSESLRRNLDLKSVQREYGTLELAIHAAGLSRVLANRIHGGQKWTRERVLEVMRQRAASGVHSLTPVLFKVARDFFGSTAAARVAADVPDPVELRMAQRRRRDGLPPAIRIRQWSRERVITTLRERASAELHAPTEELARAARRYCGGLEAARKEAGVPSSVAARMQRRRELSGGSKPPTPTRGWSRDRVIAVLRERAKRGLHTPTSQIYQAARRYFGGIEYARAAARVPNPVDLRQKERRDERRGRFPVARKTPLASRRRRGPRT